MTLFTPRKVDNILIHCGGLAECWLHALNIYMYLQVNDGNKYAHSVNYKKCNFIFC